MRIREYMDADERGWVRCRLIAFLDCAYFRDVRREKERYAHPAVCLVAEDAGRIIGLLDAELDSDELTCRDSGRGAILWHLAVLPEYRRQGVAAALWTAAEARLAAAGVRRCELWTQEDAAANRFYTAMGFALEPAQTWLRCSASPGIRQALLSDGALGEIYGVEELVFEAPFHRKAALMSLCNRIDEVRLYAKALGR